MDIHQLIGLLELLGGYTALWLGNTLLGMHVNIKQLQQDFEWAKLRDGIIKYGALGLAGILGFGAIFFAPHIFEANGVALSQETADAISLVGIIGAIASGYGYYGIQFVKNMTQFFSKPEVTVTTTVPDLKAFNDGVVVLDLSKTVTQSDDSIAAQKTAEEQS